MPPTSSGFDTIRQSSHSSNRPVEWPAPCHCSQLERPFPNATTSVALQNEASGYERGTTGYVSPTQAQFVLLESGHVVFSRELRTVGGTYHLDMPLDFEGDDTDHWIDVDRYGVSGTSSSQVSSKPIAIWSISIPSKASSYRKRPADVSTENGTYSILRGDLWRRLSSSQSLTHNSGMQTKSKFHSISTNESWQLIRTELAC